ncbi:MAG: hypothetical protein JF886_01365 [Candidatus Dormibacteraeota bacterium]|uniref:Uncharacterized protein n=1 Tax=Candidatus Aeolococcus gillhamiae TaxID=3127015 RepID=A0A934JUS0_9BACT|nr:hypothetical protein [Candidatus Dormibacteraeota bacterium]
MPLFGRRPAAQQEWFTVGAQGHRVLPGSPRPGIEPLESLGEYVEAISVRRPPGPDGRDSIAVLNAKMDHADTVNDLVAAAVLTCEELVERGLLDKEKAPPPPPHQPLRRDTTTYEYIQQLHERAVERRAWLEDVDGLLRARRVSLLAPLPVEG